MKAAAKWQKDGDFSVASIFDIPVKDESVDCLINVFAPMVEGEFARVLKKDGVRIMVIPAERHLWQLKCAVYDEPYLNEVKDFSLDGFELLSRKTVADEITLPCSEDIEALFSMTPYYYKTGVEGQQRLSRLETLTTEIGFEVLAYRKNNI